ncbi:MAG: YdcF family protein [Bifidobacteriaceae bacterium]|jgi:uncharacterized SAM-binding protein YcdF (DUF218 family)|nr:YdcF family protein [Bifidobacteriaceae bacterium]
MSHRRAAVSILIRLILLAVGGTAIYNAAYLAVKTNMNLGLVLEAAVGLVMVAFAVWRRLATIRWLRVTAVVAGVAILAASGALAWFGTHDTASDRDEALIVLGAGVHGRTVTAVLAARLDVAREYHERNPNALIVVTGGQGAQEDIPEAEAMRDYLVARGVASDQIVMEPRSTSTAENFANAKALLDPILPAGYRVAFVTSEFHVFRASLIARDAGLRAEHLHSGTLWYVQPSSYLREIVAVTKQLVLG